MIRGLLVVIICALSYTGAYGQTCGLFVKVFQNNRKLELSISGVKVRIAGKKISVIANSVKAESFEGFYLAKNMPSGTHQVTASKPGFMTSKQELEVKCLDGSLQTQIEMFAGSTVRTRWSRSKATDAVFNAKN